jgi:hypothetical protein
MRCNVCVNHACKRHIRRLARCEVRRGYLEVLGSPTAASTTYATALGTAHDPTAYRIVTAAAIALAHTVAAAVDAILVFVRIFVLVITVVTVVFTFTTAI